MSDRCGNRFELDARVVRFGDVDGMAREMLAVERGVVTTENTEGSENLGRYDCRDWARRTLAFAKELT